MPLWLDLLCTPMAAPEDRSLRATRYGWQMLCLSCAGATCFFKPLHAAVGQAAPIGIALLIAVTLAVTAVYLQAKHRADAAFIAKLGSGE